MLRSLIESRAVEFRAGESDRVALRLDDALSSAAASQGVSLKNVCQAIWPGDENPVRRRPELRKLKKARKLLQYSDLIAGVIQVNPDDFLIEAFRDTRFDEAANARLAGKARVPDLDLCWRVLSDTIHALAKEISRTEGLEEHQRAGISTPGRFDLAFREIRGVSAISNEAVVFGPLAHGSAYIGSYPLIPSVVLFDEERSESARCILSVEAIGYEKDVLASVNREVRLAIGPADGLTEPSPLFEFRSVLDVFAHDDLDDVIKILSPWHDLESKDLIVQIDGEWHEATLSLPDGFSANLEEGIQFEHHDVAWRPVTAASCRDLFDRGAFSVAVHSSYADDYQVTICPPHTLGAHIESLLFAGGDDSVVAKLRVDAKQVVEQLRAWQAEQVGAAITAHELLRARWRNWS